MSPEQVQGLEIDGRSDQFSLAVIAYEILTGERPFQGEHLSTIVYKIVAEEPAAAQRINSTLTPQIDQVLRRGLAKKREDRYPNCSNFVGALEMACAESRGWTTLTAGASGVMPTDSVLRPKLPLAASPTLPTIDLPAAQARESRQRPSIFVPLLLSLMVVLGVAAVIVWQAGLMPQVVSFLQDQPILHSLAFWQTQPSEQAEIPRKREPIPTPQPAPVTDSAPAPPTQPTDSPAVDSASVDSVRPARQQSAEPAFEKPSPLAPPAKPEQDVEPLPVKPARTSPVRTTREAPHLQDVWVSTNPPGAKAVLDDDLSQACRTPCMVHAATGIHNLTISQAGYENEYRELRIGDTAQDVPPITLRKPSGTLMLTTNPPGASVRVNGQLIQQVTPAQITLPPGNYSIAVEKGGRTQTQRVEIGQGMVYLAIPLNQ
jgi:serine/threonine-protein kinase